MAKVADALPLTVRLADGLEIISNSKVVLDLVFTNGVNRKVCQ